MNGLMLLLGDLFSGSHKSLSGFQSPSSSSDESNEQRYDVFLNFRGQDTRYNFTKTLYDTLHRKGICTFMDNEELVKGEEITPSLTKAIQGSRIAIIIFSKNYASSAFCLDELVQILDCMKENGRLVLPIFYDVEPSVVRHQTENYKEAFIKHEIRYKDEKEKVQTWRWALKHAADLSGFHFKPGQEYESESIKRIVKEISRRISRQPLHIATHPVGIESRVLKVKSLLEVGSNGVQMVGIYGIGGIGKSTIARAVCNLIVDSFEGFCFLADVRENSVNHGLVYLQEMLLSEVFEEDIKLRDVNKGIPIIKHRLHRKKVLLVLDDVDKIKQLQVIAGGLDWFGSGSRIIITTRDKHLLVSHGVERIYEVDGLNKEEALELLKWNAFKQSTIDASYMDILKNAVLYACGLPLALEVIGSNLIGREKSDWDSALDDYNKIPDKDIQQVLKVSFDALGHSEKEIFLDIACCFKGDNLEYVKNVLNTCRDGLDNGIKVLIDKSLIKIDFDHHVIMHDLIQAMGKEIVRDLSPKYPGGRTRLWFYKDIIEVLEENKGTEKIEVINLDMPGEEQVDWNGEAFQKMPDLKILIIRNARLSTSPKCLPNSLKVLDWKGCRCSSFPSDFNPKKLIILKMSQGCLQLDEQPKKFQSLSIMDFTGCDWTRVPDLSEVRNLKVLRLEDCPNLTEVHVSIGFLSRLEKLSVKGCRKLKNFPDLSLPSLEFLDFSECTSLSRFPEILEKMEKIKDVILEDSGIEELPASFENLTGLQILELKGCKRLTEIRGIPPNIKKLFATSCGSLTEETRSRLIDQALHEVDGLNFLIEGFVRPKWLDYQTWSSYVSFWFRKKLPNLALCVAISNASHVYDLWFKIQINGQVCGTRSWMFCSGQLIYLFDLQRLLPKHELESVVLGHEWDHLRIDYFPIPNVRIEWTGIYVYRKKSSMEDIQFTNPYLSKMPLFDFNLFKRSYPFHKSENMCQRTGASSIAADQALHKVDVLTFEMSEDDITPEGFHHCIEGDSMPFWIRNGLPDMVLCFAVGIGPQGPDRQMSCPVPHVIINGNNIDIDGVLCRRMYGRFTLYDVFFFPGSKVKGLVLQHGWNHGMISRILIPEYYAHAKWSGIYVDKQNFKMEDLSFTDPEINQSYEFGVHRGPMVLTLPFVEY